MKAYYQDDFVTIYHGDCREMLPSFDSESIDLILTDPPYGTELLAGGYGRRQNHDPAGRLGRTIVGDKDLAVLEETVVLFRTVLKNPGLVGSFCAARRMNEVDRIFRDVGLEFFGELIWDKGAPGLGATVRYSHESCLLYRNGKIATPELAALSVVRSCVNRIDTQSRHPHEKPVEFWLNAARLLPGLILDPFMGSGTTLRAVKDLGRQAIGIEIEERYCEMAARRLSQEVFKFEPQSEPATTMELHYIAYE